MDISKLNKDNDLFKLNNLLDKALSEEVRRKKYADKEKARQKHLLELNKDKIRKQAILEQCLQESERLLEKVIVWEFLLAISHHVMQVCSNCGHSREYHSGYYHIEQNVKNSLKRLQHVERKPINYKIFYTQSRSSNCIDCENADYMLQNSEIKTYKNLLDELEYKNREV